MIGKLLLSAKFPDRPTVPAIVVKGRDAWALRALVRAGKKGCTPIDTPGPRWSAYVLKLRKAGFHILTVHERHQGPFPGRHARYVLMDRVELAEDNPAHAHTNVAR